jgi:hypothetical protein
VKWKVDRKTMHQSLKKNKREFSPEQRKELLRALKTRFEKNMNRHNGLDWANAQARLQANTEKLLVTQ